VKTTFKPSSHGFVITDEVGVIHALNQ